MNKVIHKYIAKIILLASLLFASTIFAKESDVSIDEQRLKIAFIFKFIDFVDSKWPVKNSETINFCVYTGNNKKLSRNIDYYLKDARYSNNKMNVLFDISTKKVNECDIVYFTNIYSGKYERIINHIKRKGVLTIGDKKYFADNYGMIEFIKYRGKIRFKINSKSAMKAGVIFNSKLLELSEVR